MNIAPSISTETAAPLTDKQEKLVKKATEAAEEFEAVFIAEMMKPMFEGISTEAPFGGDKGEEIFRGMLLQEYGKMIAHTGSIGLSSSIKDAMIRMQAQADNKGVEIQQ